MAAIEEESHRQRCLAHKLRNLASKLPRDPERRDPVMQAGRGRLLRPGPRDGRASGERFIDDVAEEYPAVATCFSDDLKACLTHLDDPLEHPPLHSRPTP